MVATARIHAKQESELAMTQAVALEVTVLVFAAYADRFGWRRQQVTVLDPATVNDVVDACRALPGGAILPEAPLVARNAQFVALATPIAHGDEIALMPPVAGG
jgi:molybdopterin converting factor small subunit